MLRFNAFKSIAVNSVRCVGTARLPPSDLTSSLIIKNLPQEVTWYGLKEVMKSFGYVKACVLNREDGDSTAIVTFRQGLDMSTVAEQVKVAPALSKFKNLEIFPYTLPEIADSDVVDIGTSRLFVKGLPSGLRWQDLKDHMRIGGNVVSVNLNIDNEMNFTGTAVVIFNTVFDASRAYAVLRKSPFRGRVLQVRPDFLPESVASTKTSSASEGSSEPAPRAVQGKKSNKLFVHNLQFEVGWQELKDHFRLAGRVGKADVLVDENGVSRGIGVVYFQTEEDAARAVETLHMSRIRNRPIYVRYDIPLEQAQEQLAATNHVYIDGIPYNAKRNDLIRLILASTEGFERCSLEKNKALEKQTAVVVFDTPENAQNAIKILNESLMLDSVLRVKAYRDWGAN